VELEVDVEKWWWRRRRRRWRRGNGGGGGGGGGGEMEVEEAETGEGGPGGNLIFLLENSLHDLPEQTRELQVLRQLGVTQVLRVAYYN